MSPRREPDPRREWDGPWPPQSKPIRVDGGIRARTARGTIGSSWWSRRFVAVMESLGGNRLARGRTYARAGQVLSLSIGPGAVTATVQGSRKAPYQVRIGLAPFPARAWDAVEQALVEQAIYSARLLAGEMPPDLEEVFTDAGMPLFPQRLADLAMSCSCPDVAVPCKHLAASVYLLAEAFDDDPFHILHWRGRDKDSLLARLRQLRDGAAAAGAAQASQPTPVAGTALALAELAPTERAPAERAQPELAPHAPGPADWDRFWLPPVPLPARPPTLDTEPDLLLRQLPSPGPALGGSALVQALTAAYRRFAVPPGQPAAED